MSTFYEKTQILKRLRETNTYTKYIEHIRYPKLRNMEKESKITFDFPVTFLVGKNGGGKSSTLQSLYACPKGYSLSDYWFTTELDPIKEFENDRNCFIYGYKKHGSIKEVLKQRAPRAGDTDYWETSRPVAKYGMTTGPRNQPLEKNVEYIDFRSELSAFDQFLYFGKFNPGVKYKTKQDFLRDKSKKLKQALDQDVILSYRNVAKNKNKIVLSSEEVGIINFILGKQYAQIQMIQHAWFGEWGFSIQLINDDLTYTEAFAGSGETAVVMLINRIYNAENESLILLDEPETSLHPGAQKRLMNYILDISISKKHQFVISTHSPFLIEDMPDESIKVFSTLPTSGKFIVNNEQNFREAFFELEITNTNKKQILVEDHFAEMLIKEVLAQEGNATQDMFEVKYLSGGADAISQRITTFMEITDNIYVFFDGDKKKRDKLIDINDLTSGEQNTYKKLRQLIIDQMGCDVKLYPDGGNVDNEKQKLELAKRYLNYCKDHVFYLPCLLPEDIVWDEEFANKRLKALYLDKEILDVISGAKDCKDNIYKLCLEIYSTGDTMISLYIEFIKNWIRKKDTNYIAIRDLINSIK